jgi:hypothetical protein
MLRGPGVPFRASHARRPAGAGLEVVALDLTQDAVLAVVHCEHVPVDLGLPVLRLMFLAELDAGLDVRRDFGDGVLHQLAEFRVVVTVH